MTNLLTHKQFDAAACTALADTIGPLGFSCSASKGCTFYRRINSDLFHFVLLDSLTRSSKFDVKVFAHSPLLEGEWSAKFPDDLGIPTGSLSYLHSQNGVGPDQQLYFCKTIDVFSHDFEARVKPALLKFAIPYLDRIGSVYDIGKLKGLHPLYAERLSRLR